jgi:hypothetical protein
MRVWKSFTTRWEVSSLQLGLDVADRVAMEPDEAAPILADFAGKLNMEMSGKFWAPSKLFTLRAIFADDPDGARGIGNAEEVMGKEWASRPGPLELPW